MAADATEEMIEEVNQDGETVAIHPVSRLRQKMFLHKGSLVIPRSKDGKFIFGKRAADKWPFPGTWVCAIGGKVRVGESYEKAAVREMEEEAKIKHDVSDLQFVSKFTYDEDDYKCIFNIYTTKIGVDKSVLQPDKREVEFFQEFSLEEFKEGVEQRPEEFAPTFVIALKSFIDGLEKVRD